MKMSENTMTMSCPSQCGRSHKKLAFIGLAVLAVAGGWYAFRPEKLFVNETVHEAAESAATQILARGTFHGVAHETMGRATVASSGDGRRVLRFEGFSTSNGPDLRVLLISANDANDSAAVKAADRVEIAPLKGNMGEQNYTLPADLDLSKFKAVTIWCNRFGVNFATAPLSAGA